MTLRFWTWLPLTALVLAWSAGAENPQGVRPPKLPHISPDLSEAEAQALPPLAQPVALHDTLSGLKEGTLDERIAKLKVKVFRDLIFMRGGTFMMGDFGPMWSPDGLPYTIEKNTKPVHKTTLTSFSISRYKTTYAEYDVYLDATAQPHLDGKATPRRNAFVPAGMTWYQAKDYCQWLGKQTGLALDLPTEAQWEYAARSRGQFFLFGTDNGSLDFGRNIDDYNQLKFIRPASDNVDIWGKHPQVWDYPVGMFPPSPMGLYDMNSNNEEWTNDWYADDYYKSSPEMNPQGPSSGRWKVTRSTITGEGPSGMNNVMRHRSDTTVAINLITGEKVPSSPAWFAVRCVANVDRPVDSKN
ncbi:formylglycine-generating enzyme family protein [Burkholderia sp. MBR-1]|uniref:formylglycine-generating enzyme family protein n=1 Tax=Burkholderia sp. MBR-1 TaxID=2732364 RepID=UPI0015EF6D68|nr:SUMF1/EgtB/PvdO family nonheme iron enzyme [Burkholderia sp. MBR-1]QMI49243.1 SUMF1/EgtB/PvdO family nonheme iron enzyme [Burkholderia sp. MBR-1]